MKKSLSLLVLLLATGCDSDPIVLDPADLRMQSTRSSYEAGEEIIVRVQNNTRYTVSAGICNVLSLYHLETQRHLTAPICTMQAPGPPPNLIVPPGGTADYSFGKALGRPVGTYRAIANFFATGARRTAPVESNDFTLR